MLCRVPRGGRRRVEAVARDLHDDRVARVAERHGGCGHRVPLADLDDHRPHRTARLEDVALWCARLSTRRGRVALARPREEGQRAFERDERLGLSAREWQVTGPRGTAATGSAFSGATKQPQQVPSP